MLFFSDIDLFKWGQKWFDDQPVFEAFSLITCLLSGLVAKICRNSMLPSYTEIVYCPTLVFFFFIRKIGRYIYLIIVFFYEINNIWSDADSTNEAAFDLLVGISALAVNPLDFRIQRIFRKASAGYTETINISFIFENLGVFVNIAWRFRQHVLIDCNM